MNAENGGKLLLSIAFFVLVYLVGKLLRVLAQLFVPGKGENERIRFWTQQALR
jgi:hypothetical protein